MKSIALIVAGLVGKVAAHWSGEPVETLANLSLFAGCIGLATLTTAWLVELSNR